MTMRWIWLVPSKICATQDLHRIGRDLHRHIGRETFCHRGIHARALPRIKLISRLIDQQAGGLNLHRHICQHKLDGLKGADRLAELLAFAGIVAGRLKSSLRYADRNGSDIDPPAIERGERDLQALALFPNEVSRRDRALFKDEFARW